VQSEEIVKLSITVAEVPSLGMNLKSQMEQLVQFCPPTVTPLHVKVVASDAFHRTSTVSPV
jgi:hypothetical protein